MYGEIMGSCGENLVEKLRKPGPWVSILLKEMETVGAFVLQDTSDVKRTVDFLWKRSRAGERSLNVEIFCLVPPVSNPLTTGILYCTVYLFSL
jgi:hypothetical protein